MKHILVELDSETWTKLERVAPARTRQRSEFVRMAIRKAIWELEERATQEAYARCPDTLDDVTIDATPWDPPAVPAPGRQPRG